MRVQDRVMTLVLSVVLIVGAYQFYFLTQRLKYTRTRIFTSKIDEAIPYWPSWTWVYSFLYYPAILYLNLVAVDARHFLWMAFSFMLLLFMQMVCFVVYPVATPDHWRKVNKGVTLSERFLRFVQKFDSPLNCFPSMHVSVAMLTALYCLPMIGPVAWLFPILIGISCLFTKQHYLIDLPPGAALGYAAWWLTSLMA